MKVVLAIDSFKGSMSSRVAGEAAALGIRDAYPDAEVIVCPVADGGEGTTEAIVCGAGGSYHTVRVSDPLGRPVEAVYGLLPSGIAVMEMSMAAGITLVSEDERSVMDSDTYGVGEMIVDALDNGARSFIIGIGGSATNDAGVGMLRALGCRFLDGEGKDVARGARSLGSISCVDVSGMDKRLKESSFVVASDVKNPLTGPLGATRIYGPQKGVKPDEIDVLDGCIHNFASLTKEIIPTADEDMPGGGAAGGLGFALVNYLGAELRPGVDIVTEAAKLAEHMRGADLVITGEGRIDAQSAMGKLPGGVARIAKEHGAIVVALAGSVADGAEALRDSGIDAALPILRSPMSLGDAMNVDNATGNMRIAARELAFLLKATGLE